VDDNGYAANSKEDSAFILPTDVNPRMLCNVSKRQDVYSIQVIQYQQGSFKIAVKLLFNLCVCYAV